MTNATTRARAFRSVVEFGLLAGLTVGGAALYSAFTATLAAPDFGWTTYERGWIAVDMDEAEALRREWQAHGGGAVYQSRVPDGVCVQTELQHRRAGFGGC